MLFIYLMVNYLYRKYGVPLHNFFENWTRGISHLKGHDDTFFYYQHVKLQEKGKNFYET